VYVERPVLRWATIGVLFIAAPNYTAQRGEAEVIPNLGRFLESYVGDCLRDDPEFNKAACESVAQNYRRTTQGKLYRVEIDDLGEMIRFSGWDSGRSASRLHLTPFFGERGLAISVGKPSGLEKGGPVVKNVPIWVKTKGKEEEDDLRRSVDRGLVRLELLMRPGKPWVLKSKDGKDTFRGVDVTLVGLRLYATRGNSVLSEQTYP
jgi:hypothetical protein